MKRILTLLVIAIIIGCSTQQSDPKVFLKEGQDLFLAGKYFEARESFLKGIILAPSDQDLLFYAGLCYQKEYVYDSALFYFKRADLLYPNSKEINLALYQVAPETEDWEYAISAIHKLVSLGDPQEKYWQDLSDFSRNKGSFVHVMYYARKLLGKYPEEPKQYLSMVNAALSANSLMTASAFIDTAIDKFGELTELTANRGAILAMTGKYSEAESIFRKLLKQDSLNPSLRLNLANTLSSYDNLDKKKEALDIFIKLRSEYGSSGVGMDSLIVELQTELGVTQ